jgi:hypothetical protein
VGQSATTREQQENNMRVLYTTWQLFHLETILESGRFMMRVEKGAMSYLLLARRICKKDKTDGTIKQNLNIFLIFFYKFKALNTLC